jgi:integrase
VTFRELFAEYSKTDSYKSLSVSSWRCYNYGAQKLSDYFGSRDATKLRRSDFIKMKDDMADVPGSVNLILRVASIMYGYALDRDLVAANPVANMKKNKLQGHEKWSPEEVSLLISEADERVAIAVALAWYTGQRESDILDMRLMDYESSDGYICLTQSKTKTEMKIKVHPDLEKLLHAIVVPKRNPTDYLVSGTKRMGGSHFRKLFSRETKRLGVEKVFHGIRKGVASSLAENGRPISEIAAMLGHKSIRMAAYYAEQADSTKLAESAVSNLTSVTVQASY